jgi:TolB protein
MRAKVTAVVLATILVALASVSPSEAAFPGANGKILFWSVRADPNPNSCGSSCNYELFAMNPDGSGVTRLTNNPGSDSGGSYSADGNKIVFSHENTGVVMNSDGTGQTSTGVQFGGGTWSPDGSKILFSINDLYTMNPDGSGITNLTNHGPPELDGGRWAPDGSKIAFSRRIGNQQPVDIYTINPDGTGETRVTDNTALGRADEGLDWSPDSSQFVFRSYGPNFDSDIYKMNRDGTGRTQLTSGPALDFGPVWSPDGTKIAFTRLAAPSNTPADIYVMNADGSNLTKLTDSAYRIDDVSDWQPLQAFPRPKGASPLRISLVPAYGACTAPNSTHGAPLAFGSCAPPALASGQLTTGTADSNGLPAAMQADLILSVVPGNPSTTADEADVKLVAQASDVFLKNLSDYTGQLRAMVSVQVTDKNNVTSGGSIGAGTTQGFPYGFDLPCTANADSQIGSDCAITTTADTLVPGTILEGKRSIWEIASARLDDAGPDGNPDTTADNTAFATQGVFVP